MLISTLDILNLVTRTKEKMKGEIRVKYRESPKMASARRRRNMTGFDPGAADGRPALLTRQGLATALSCSLRSVDHLQTKGIPFIRVGKSRRFLLSEVVAWLKRQGGRR